MLDVLVNNARHRRARGRSPDSAADPALQASGHGRMVNVSTLAAGGLGLTDTRDERRRFSGIGAYRASKHAVPMFTWTWPGD